METFGIRVCTCLLAASTFLPLAGCSKSPSDEFSSYDDLKKPAVHAIGAPDPTQNPLKNDADPRTKPSPRAPAASAPRTVMKTPAVVQSSGTGAVGTSAYHASVAAAAPSKALPPRSAAGASRKVQLLVAQRAFKPEGNEGALRVTYDDIDLLKVLNMDPVTADAATLMPGWLKNLDGRRIRIRGFMYPTFQQTGVHAFGLARDNQICCFGRNPKIYDVFDVALRKGATTDYIPNRPFDVVGVFHIRPEADEGKLYRLYEMDDAIVVTR